MTRSDFWIYAALLAVVFALYAQVHNFEFVNFDDPVYVTQNPHVRDGLTLDGLKWTFTSGYAANWFPLTWISYMLDVQIFGLSSGAQHLTNVFLHAVSSLLLFALMKRMTGARWASAFVAFAFAIHPLHIESVAWIAERKDVLSGLFWFLTLWAYLNYVEKPSRVRYSLIAVFFACGLMAKPMIVTLPFVLLLLDRWPLKRGGKLLEKLPLFAMAAASSAVTYFVQKSGGAITPIPLHFRLENALISYIAYVFDFFWPARLAALYPYPASIPAWQWIGSAVAILAITAFAYFQFRRRPYFAIGWLWYLGTLVPVIGLVQVGVQPRADRYTYIPLIGLSIAVAWAIDRRILALACCAWCAVAWPDVGYWRNTISLFTRAVDVTHDNWIAENALGQALMAQGRVDDAIPYFNETIRLRPKFPDARVNLAAALTKRADFAAAAEQYRIALQLQPGNGDAQEGLGVALTEKGELQEALPHLLAAVKAMPDDPDAHYNLGRLYGLAHRPDLAAVQFSETVRLQPDNAAARFNLGTALAAQERFADAAQQFDAALRIKQDYVNARFNLASALANMGRFDEAIGQFQEVVRAQPDFAGARQAIEALKEMKKR